MRQIIFHEETKTFHLYNEKISYILCVLENGHLGQLYFGKRLHDKADFSYLVEKCERPMTSYIYEWDRTFSLEHIRQEYPVYGTTDYRHPAIELLQENGSRISEFQYDSYEIIDGKPKLSGLPATYTESEGEAQTFLIKAATAAAGGLTGIGLQIVGYNAKAVTQSAATVMGIRVLMIVIPIILAFASFGIYKKYYILKGEKMEEITRKVNEMHAKKQTA